LKWPLHLIAAVLFAAWAGLSLGGLCLYTGEVCGIILIIVMAVSFGALWLMRLFRKQVLRSLLGRTDSDGT